jgi:hypothetical protein
MSLTKTQKIDKLEHRLGLAKSLLGRVRMLDVPQDEKAEMNALVRGLELELKALREDREIGQAAPPFLKNDKIWSWSLTGREWIQGTVIGCSRHGRTDQYSINLEFQYAYLGGSGTYRASQIVHWPACQNLLKLRTNNEPPEAP